MTRADQGSVNEEPAVGMSGSCERPMARLAPGPRATWLRTVGRISRRRGASRMAKLAWAPGRLLRTRFATWVMPHEATARLFFGDRMRVFLPEPVSHHLYTYGMFEDDLTAILLKHLRPGSIMIDVGAHFGYFTLLGLRLVGERGAVHAFEPTPTTFELLRRNVADRANVVVNRQALFSTEGSLTFRDYGMVFSAFNGYTAPQTKVDPRMSRRDPVTTVPCDTLDNYCRRHTLRPDFIKIDAESAELAVLEGAEAVLRRTQPTVIVEMSDLPGKPSGRRCIAFMGRLGYRVYEHAGAGRTRPHQPRSEYHNTRLLFLPQRPSGSPAAAQARPLGPDATTQGRRARVCLAEVWPGITAADLDPEKRPLPKRHGRPRFAYALAFPDHQFCIDDQSRPREAPARPSTTVGRLMRRSARLVRAAGRAARLTVALARADVVVSYLTSYLLLAGLVKHVRPGLRIVTLRYRLAPAVGRVRKWLDQLKRFAYRRADRIACLVPSQVPAFAARYGLAAEQVVWIPFGVDTTFFSPGPSPADHAPFVVVPGNQQRDENIVLAQARAGGVRLVRIANTPWVRQTYSPALRDEPTLGRWLTFEQHLPALRLRELYRTARLAWIPLVVSDEPAGLTVALEAAACGCPLLLPEGLTTEVLDRLGVPHTAYGPDEAPADALARMMRTPPSAAARRALVESVRARASVEVASRALQDLIASPAVPAAAIEEYCG